MYPKGWTPLRNLRKGDLVAVTKEFPALGNKLLSPFELDLLPQVLVNTFIDGDTVVALNKSEEQFSDLKERLTQYGYTIKKENSRYIIENSEEVKELYYKYRISDSFRHRRIPDEIYQLEERALKSFITSLFSSNVLLVKNENETKIKFYHRSEEFIRDLSFLLLKFGISAKVYEKESGDFWVLRVLNIAKFVAAFDTEGALDYLVDGNPDSKLNWRYQDVPEGTYWEKIREVNYIGEDWTVAISVPKYECYLTDFFQHNSYLAGGLTSWNYDVFDKSMTLTAGPSEDAITDGIWREIREHREKLPENLREFIA